jgi:hypothetical protein
MRLAVGQTSSRKGAVITSLDWEAIGRLVRDGAREAAAMDLVMAAVVGGTPSWGDEPGPADDAT